MHRQATSCCRRKQERSCFAPAAERTESVSAHWQSSHCWCATYIVATDRGPWRRTFDKTVLSSQNHRDFNCNQKDQPSADLHELLHAECSHTITEWLCHTMHHALQSKQESGASCPDSRRPSANNRPTLSHKASTEGGSRVKNPVFHAPNCDILAHTPGKRYAWQPT